jgi:hypothetical protein
MGLSQKTLLGGAGLAGAGMISALGFAAVRWDRATSQLVQRLEEAGVQSGDGARSSDGSPDADTRAVKPAGTVDFARLGSLPAPVARYFRFALRDGQPMIRAARVEQRGHFRTGDALSKWQPFAATAHYNAQRPGFVWDAAIQMALLSRICVRDTYVAGAATMQAKILAIMTVVDAHGRSELDTAALQRYLAEAVWFPTALLAAAGVRWDAIDDRRATATLTDGAATATLEFTFGDHGGIDRIHTPGRYREVNGRYALTPWDAHLRHYQERDGMQVPLTADVAWQVAGESVPYFKARVADIRHVMAT